MLALLDERTAVELEALLRVLLEPLTLELLRVLEELPEERTLEEALLPLVRALELTVPLLRVLEELLRVLEELTEPELREDELELLERVDEDEVEVRLEVELEEERVWATRSEARSMERAITETVAILRILFIASQYLRLTV